MQPQLKPDEKTLREAKARLEALNALRDTRSLALNQYETVLFNLFEMLKNTYPSLNLDLLFESRDDKQYVLKITAQFLLNHEGKLNEKNLEDPQYLNKLAFTLLHTMVANAILNQKNNYEYELRQRNEITQFEKQLEPLRQDEQLTPKETGLFDLFIEGFNETFNKKTGHDPRTPQEQNRMQTGLDKMKDSLSELEKVNPALGDKINKLTLDFFKKMDQLGRENAEKQEKDFGKEIDDNCSTLFREMSKLTPRPQPGNKTTQTEEEKQKEELKANPEKTPNLDPKLDPNNSKAEEAVVDYISGGHMVTIVNRFGKGTSLQMGDFFPPIFNLKAGDPNLKDELIMMPSTAPTPFRTNPNPYGH
jgi:hypothetical protein